MDALAGCIPDFPGHDPLGCYSVVPIVSVDLRKIYLGSVNDNGRCNRLHNWIGCSVLSTHSARVDMELCDRGKYRSSSGDWTSLKFAC